MTPATPEEVAQSLAFALLFNGRKRARGGDTMMADIVAKRLVEHLEASGFILMKKPPAPGHSAPDSYGTPHPLEE